MLWTLAGAGLAGFGLDYLRARDLAGAGKARVLAGILTGLWAVVSLGAWIFSQGPRGQSILWQRITGFLLEQGGGQEHRFAVDRFDPVFLESTFTMAQHSLLTTLVLLALAASWSWARASRLHPGRSWLALGLGLTLLDLGGFGARFVKGIEPEQAQWEPGLVAFFRSQTEPFRVVDGRAHPRHNVGMTHRNETVGGFDP